MSFFGFPQRENEIMYAFRALHDEKVCDECGMLDNAEYMVSTPEMLLRIFPYVEEVSEDFFKPNIHPNCRCLLEKVSETLFEQPIPRRMR